MEDSIKRLQYLFLVLFFVSCIGDKKFDKKQWAENPNDRYKMTQDLIESKLLIGKNKSDIKELLSDDCKYCDNESDAWMYYLGEGEDAVDFKWEVLDVEFKNDTVFSVTVRE